MAQGLLTIILFVVSCIFVTTLVYSSPLLAGTTMGQTQNNLFNKIANTTTQITDNNIQISGGAFFGTLSFPNVFGIFYAIFTLIFTLATLPLSWTTSLDLPTFITYPVGIILQLAFVLLAYSWFKGNDSVGG